MKCKNCRAIIPLLKTRWLCKKDNKRVLLTMKPNKDRTGVVFGIEVNPKLAGRDVGTGTMSRAGTKCPCCSSITTMEDVRLEGRAGRLDASMTCVVVDTENTKQYRNPTDDERRAATAAFKRLAEVYRDVPFGLPNEPLPSKEGLGIRAPLYGLDAWAKLFAHRQLLAMGTFLKNTRLTSHSLVQAGYDALWRESTLAYLSAMLDRLANQNSTGTMWNTIGEKVEQTFARFALPMHWVTVVGTCWVQCGLAVFWRQVSLFPNCREMSPRAPLTMRMWWVAKLIQMGCVAFSWVTVRVPVCSTRLWISKWAVTAG